MHGICMKHSEKCLKVIVCYYRNMFIHKHTVNSHLVSLVQRQWLVAHLMSLWLVWQSVVWMMVVLV